MRADAERSIAAILDAAVQVLADRPEAGMGEIAKAAGVARQTVYAHFPSREALLSAVAERALAQTLAAIDAAEPERGDAGEALDRLVVAWWGSVARHARVLEALASAVPSRDELHAFHGPVLARVEALARRGDVRRVAGVAGDGLPGPDARGGRGGRGGASERRRGRRGAAGLDPAPLRLGPENPSERWLVKASRSILH